MGFIGKPLKKLLGFELDLVGALTPDLPDVTKPPEPEIDRAKEIATLSNEKRRRRSVLQGRKSTIKTSPLGATGTANVKRKTLLGE